MSLNESIVEDAALEWFGELGYSVGHGPHLAPGEPGAERDTFSEVVLVRRLRDAIRRLNFSIPAEAREEALRKVLRVGTPSLTQTNRAFHQMLRDGVPVEYPPDLQDEAVKTVLAQAEQLSAAWADGLAQAVHLRAVPAPARASTRRPTAARSG